MRRFCWQTKSFQKFLQRILPADENLKKSFLHKINSIVKFLIIFCPVAQFVRHERVNSVHFELWLFQACASKKWNQDCLKISFIKKPSNDKISRSLKVWNYWRIMTSLPSFIRTSLRHGSARSGTGATLFWNEFAKAWSKFGILFRTPFMELKQKFRFRGAKRKCRLVTLRKLSSP